MPQDTDIYSYFPYARVREIQKDMLSDIYRHIKEKKDMIIHAPTGIGKTVSALVPAIAQKDTRTIFFLTSRHTQHKIALETVKEIAKKSGKKIPTANIVGKKWMCCVPGIDAMYAGDFADYCKRQKEEGLCEFYNNTREKNKVSVKAKKVLATLKEKEIQNSEYVFELCKDEKLCPYEISILMAQKARVIIADYYYVFSPFVREHFFNRTQKELDNAIIIVDEAHNLPQRIRELLSTKITTFVMENALKEAKKFGFPEVIKKISQLQDVFNELQEEMDLKQEVLIEKNDLITLIERITSYEEMISDFQYVGDQVREKQRQSFVGSIAHFLEEWQRDETGFARILSVKSSHRGTRLELAHRCLDPAIITKEVVDTSYATILMSGTLTPTIMYKELLGFDHAIEKEYDSPFPEHNRLSLIIPETSTKYSTRTPEQFKKISIIAEKIIRKVKGNTALFFPSYKIRDDVYSFLYEKVKHKTLLLEKPGMNKRERNEMLEQFKKENKKGGILFGVASGSFGEGIDLPGDFLRCVIIIGLPLDPPDMEKRSLIAYYDEKFGKGWDYGYILPAITKTLQNAGRCIRSETDTGAIIFLDERYAWPQYKQCFPKDWNITVTKMYEERLEKFFSEKKTDTI